MPEAGHEARDKGAPKCSRIMLRIGAAAGAAVLGLLAAVASFIHGCGLGLKGLESAMVLLVPAASVVAVLACKRIRVGALLAVAICVLAFLCGLAYTGWVHEHRIGDMPMMRPPAPLLASGFSVTATWRDGQDDVLLQVDLLGTQQKETIVLGRDRPNGTKLVIVEGGEGWCLGSDIKGLDDFGFLPEGSSCSLAIGDITGDGRQEILVAVGFVDASAGNHLTVWSSSASSKAATRPESYAVVGHIEGAAPFVVLDDGKIQATSGEGLPMEYVWDGKALKRRPAGEPTQ